MRCFGDGELVTNCTRADVRMVRYPASNMAVRRYRLSSILHQHAGMLFSTIHLPGPWNNDQHPPLLTVMWLLTGRVLKPEVWDAGSSLRFVLGQSARFSYKMNNLQSENFSTNAFQTKETSTQDRVLGLQAARWPAKHFSCQPNSSLCQDSQHQSPFYCIEDFKKKNFCFTFCASHPTHDPFFLRFKAFSPHGLTSRVREYGVNKLVGGRL